MTWTRSHRIASVVLALAVFACGGGDGDGDAGGDGDAPGDRIPAAEYGVTAQDPALVEAGAPLFAANCAVCHGDDAQGTDQGPSLLSEVYEPGHHADGAFQVAVLHGVRAHHWDFGDMPPVPGLSPDDVAAVTAYIRDRQLTEGFEPYRR